MIKTLFSLLLLSSPVMAEEPVKETRWPTYCIRSVEQNDVGYLLDMPGWPYGMNDKPLQVSSLDRIEDVNECSPNDPRMTND